MFRTANTFDTIRNLMNSFPAELFAEFELQTTKCSTSPAINVMEKDGEQIIAAQLPGLKKEELTIEIEKNQLKISAKTAAKKEEQEKEAGEEKKEKMIYSERKPIDFERTIVVPYRIDAANVSAELKNGILTVRLPRIEADKPRKVEIS